MNTTLFVCDLRSKYVITLTRNFQQFGPIYISSHITYHVAGIVCIISIYLALKSGLNP